MEPSAMTEPLLVDDPSVLQPLLTQAAASGRVAIDVESNGLYVYQPQLCMVQAAWEDGPQSVRVALLDTLAFAPEHLAPLLQDASITKVIHDLAFDARILRKHGIRLAGVRDTSVAAHYLDMPATGLASLLGAEFGVQVDKKLQTANWGRRPIDTASLAYLAGDVSHLLALHDRLWAGVEELGITDEVEAETAYRLEGALEEAAQEPPPWVRIRGADRLDDMGKAVLRELAEARELLAARRNVPLFHIVGDKQLIALATERPQLVNGVRRVLAPGRGARDQSVFTMIDTAMARGVAAGKLTEEEEHWLSVERWDRETAQRRKSVDQRLAAWRAAEAKRRAVSEQVVLPSHCLKRIVSSELREPDAIARLPGLGDSRARRYALPIARIVDDVLAGGT